MYKTLIWILIGEPFPPNLVFKTTIFSRNLIGNTMKKEKKKKTRNDSSFTNIHGIVPVTKGNVMSRSLINIF